MKYQDDDKRFKIFLIIYFILWILYELARKTEIDPAAVIKEINAIEI